jgi:hypothetical protein
MQKNRDCTHTQVPPHPNALTRLASGKTGKLLREDVKSILAMKPAKDVDEVGCRDHAHYVFGGVIQQRS